MIAEMIAALKSNMLPSLVGSSGGLMLTYPNMANITLYPNDYFTYKFKPAVLTNLSVEFSPESPSFFRSTGAPTHVVLTTNFQEIEYWLKDDIESPTTADQAGSRAQAYGSFAGLAAEGAGNLFNSIFPES
jgi:hypothetical protein